MKYSKTIVSFYIYILKVKKKFYIYFDIHAHMVLLPAIIQIKLDEFFFLHRIRSERAGGQR